MKTVIIYDQCGQLLWSPVFFHNGFQGEFMQEEYFNLDDLLRDLDQRVQVLITSDGIDGNGWPDNPIYNLTPAEYREYRVPSAISISSHSNVYRSPEAEAKFPDHKNVRIRVEKLYFRRPAK